MMKRLLPLIFTAATVALFAGCGEKPAETKPADSDAPAAADGDSAADATLVTLNVPNMV